MREMLRDYLKNNNISIKSGMNMSYEMSDMMSISLECKLYKEFNEELGYSKYDYRNKDMDNSRDEHLKKTTSGKISEKAK